MVTSNDFSALPHFTVRLTVFVSSASFTSASQSSVRFVTSIESVLLDVQDTSFPLMVEGRTKSSSTKVSFKVYFDKISSSSLPQAVKPTLVTSIAADKAVTKIFFIVFSCFFIF